MTRRAQAETFVAWLTGPASQREVGGGSGRTFRDRHAWCWRIEPAIAVTGEVFDEVQLDGIYLAGGWCALIAITRGTVVGLQWCDTEKKAAWMALLECLPAPRAVIVDGGSGLASALAATWPDTAVQRCLVHVQRNARGYLTRHPRTDAGRTLRALSLQLTKCDRAVSWTDPWIDWDSRTGTDVVPIGARPREDFPYWLKAPPARGRRRPRCGAAPCAHSSAHPPGQT
ncbi:transposase [Myceligenerans indicum]|uniref:Mutator family transposase n=1 Tax=Myceligenerans indicum TaxID=2593663 RepID=A0ABS1LLR4_9MICO|nr:transposase [Myceligenerans indicum]MBL0887174.1 hypothetical protein [Myceligenerans indicum]